MFGSRLSANQWFALVLVASAAISALSLWLIYAIDFDPSGWVVYGREVFGPGVLDTRNNPAWKPFPIILDGLFSLITRGEADAYFWLFVARTMGILVVVGSARLAARYAGWWAGGLTALLLVISPWWVESTTIGQDGPPTAAFMLGGIFAYQRGWTRAAWFCAIAASLIRPEAAIFALVFGIYAWREKRLTIWEVIGGMVVIAGLWLVPTILHTGYSPGTIASKGGVAGTAIRTKDPFVTVFSDAAGQLLYPPAVLVGVAILVTLLGLARVRRPAWLIGLWGRSLEERVLVAAGFAWVLIVALETIDGFSGNVRYMIPAFTLLSIVAGVVAIRIVKKFRYLGAAVVVAGLAATMVLAIHPLRLEHGMLALRQRQMVHIHQQIKQYRCSGYYWANQANFAYVAMLTNQSLPASKIAFPALLKRAHHTPHLVYCSPSDWKPPPK